MTTQRPLRTAAVLLLAAGSCLLPLRAVRAETLSFTNTPASNAVAEMSRRLGVSIVFRGVAASTQPVTFSVDDVETSGGRLAAVSELANALHLDFQKVYVVSKIDPGTSVPEIKVDSDVPIIFPSTRVSAREAIQTVAAVDGAMAQISGAVEGDVILPSRQMRAAAAATTIAKQTGTVWKAYYGLFLPGQGPSRLGGQVLDRTADGQPITVLPLLTFRNTISRPAPISGGLPPAPSSFPDGPDVTSTANTNGFDGSGYGSSPFDYGGMYGGYGGYSPYGYDSSGGFIYPGAVYTPGSGITAAVPGYNSPGYGYPGGLLPTQGVPTQTNPAGGPTPTTGTGTLPVTGQP